MSETSRSYFSEVSVNSLFSQSELDMSGTSSPSISEVSVNSLFSQSELHLSGTSSPSISEVSDNSLFSPIDLKMSDRRPSSSSEGSEATKNELDIYLQAVFGHIHPSHYGMVTPNMRVIQYSRDSPEFWSSLQHFIRFASKYRSLLNEDLVMVIQDGANVYGAIVSYLEGTELNYKYLVGPNNCFILTVMSTTHEATSHDIPQNLIYESQLGRRIKTGGQYRVYLCLHSMREICSSIFSGQRSKIRKATRVVRDKNRDKLGIKLPDNCAFPRFLPLIRSIQGAPMIPTLMLETGMSDDTTKIEGDCISIILGVNFTVESVIGINICTNKKSRELESLCFIVFDVSVEAMLGLYNELTSDYEKALLSVVLKRKALFKHEEVNAIRQLKDCIDSNGNYKSVCDNIANKYRQGVKQDPMRLLNAPVRPDKGRVRKLLGRFEFNSADLLIEERCYEAVIELCDETLDLFEVQSEFLDDDTVREAESFVVQKLYQKRTVQIITAEAQQDLTLPSTALSSTHWWRQPKLVLPAKALKESFTDISFHCM